MLLTFLPFLKSAQFVQLAISSKNILNFIDPNREFGTWEY